MPNHKSVLLDTGFCIRLLSTQFDHHQNAKDYFKYFLDNSVKLYLSSIVVAEYAVKDDPNNLPLTKVRHIPFDLNDGVMAGKFFSQILQNRPNWEAEGLNRVAVKDDCKLMAQIHNRGIEGFLTADSKAERKIIKPIKENFGFDVELINIKNPLKHYTGELF